MNQWRRELLLVVSLLAVGAGIKGWLLAHTEVLTRDGIGFIMLANRLDREPWSKVLPSAQQHPLYPLHILYTHEVVSQWLPRDDCRTWQLSAQLADIVWSVLLVVPMYFLGKSLFNPAVGFWAALLFQAWPVPARVTADALTEGLYLFWTANALLFTVWGLQRRSIPWFALSGAAGGVAFLVRPEGALVIVAAGIVLVLTQTWRTAAAGWGRTLTCAAALGASGALVAAPYWWMIGGLTVKPAAEEVLSISQAGSSTGMEESAASAHVLLAARFSPGTESAAAVEARPGFALLAVFQEIGKGSFYVGWIPATLALWWYRRQFLSLPGLGVLVVLIALNIILLWRVAFAAGYVSERHTLLMIAAGSFFTAAGLLEFPARWQRWRANTLLAAPFRARELGGEGEKVCKAASGGRPAPIVLAILVALFLAASFRTLRPLHPHRVGQRLAGEWLATRFQPGDSLIDPYGWATFYSGQATARPFQGAPPSRFHRYTVIEPHDRDANRLELINRATRTGLGEPVFRWPPEGAEKVAVYRAAVGP